MNGRLEGKVAIITGASTGLGPVMGAMFVREGAKVLLANVSITAKAFFLSRGFHIIEAKSNVILGHPAPNFRMQKTVRVC